MHSVLNEGLPFAALISAVTTGNKKATKDAIQDVLNREKRTTTSNGSPLIGSISSYTKDLTMTFPLLTDTGISAETASMISRANERNIVTMFQMFFASQSFSGTNGIEILKSLHKNLGKDSIYMADIFKAATDLAESGSIDYNSSYSVQLNNLINEMVKELKTPKKSFPVNSFSEHSVNDYVVLDIYGRTVVKEAPEMIDDPAHKGNSISKAQWDANRQYNNDLDAKKRYEDEAKEREKDRKERKDARKEDRGDRLAKDEYERNQDSYLNAVNSNRNRLISAEVKKSNELQPTLIGVDYTTPAGQTRQFVAGIKSRIVPIDTMDIIERVVSKNKNKISFANFIKATTGETKFWRDFIFAAKQAKLNAKNAAKKGPAAQIWNMLEKRSAAAARNKYKADNNNDASRITGLVLSQNTVEYMKRVSNFDIEKPANAKQIMDAYNLMSIFIADPSVETVKSIYDGNDMYETQAYSFLQREGNEMNYKKVIDLMSNMRR